MANLSEQIDKLFDLWQQGICPGGQVVVRHKGELVYDPFAGLMTVPYRAILLGRRGGGSELCDEYFRDGTRYLAIAESKATAPTLFDMEMKEEVKASWIETA